MNPTAPLKCFCSYAHTDEEGLEQLRNHLSGLRRQGLIEDWHDRQIPPGGEWDTEIERNLNQADLILLLVSASFINSDYCMEVETAQALIRHQKGSATVVSIFWRQCDADDLPFMALQGTPSDRRWIAEQQHQDKAWTEVAKAVREAALLRLGVGPLKRRTLALIRFPISASPSHLRWILPVLIVGMGIAGYSAWRYFTLPETAEALLEQGEYRQAQQECEQAAASAGRSRCLKVANLMLEKLDPERFYEQARRVDSAYALAVMAEAAANRENYAEAEKYYRQAMELNPRVAQAYYGMGQIMHLQNRLPDALDWYRQAVQQAPRNRRFLLNLASIYAERGELVQAESAYRKLLGMDANLMLAYVELLDVLLKQHKREQAAQLAQRGLTLLEQSPALKEEPLNQETWFIMVDGKPRYLDAWELKRSYLLARFAQVGKT